MPRSSFEVIGSGAKYDECYSSYELNVTDKDIQELQKGNKLYTTINYGEYAIVIKHKHTKKKED